MKEFFSRIEGFLARPRALSKNVGTSRKRDPALEAKVRMALHAVDPALGDLVTAGWNSRMRTTAGVAVLGQNQIWLNPALREVSSEEVERTLLHELAHLLARHRYPHRRIDPHGEEWRTACRDLGIPGESRTHRLPFHARRLKRRFILRCPVCGRHHERVRRPKRDLACLHCCRIHNGGLYDEKYRFSISTIQEDPARY
jgi:predicted SprT family Zn-dependent metalloprotease